MDLKQNIRVYFLGSGKIGIPVLEVLVKSSDIDLVGVGSQVDRPAGRKRHLHPTPVGEWAAENKIDVDKIPNVNCDEFLDKLRTLEPDFIFVASFGQLLKQQLLELPRKCCLNLHASLLPAYRGASPLAAAILNGDEYSGVAFMEMEKGLDTGPIYSLYKYKMPDSIKENELEIALGEVGAEHVEDVLHKIMSGEMTATVQNHDLASYAKKIHKKAGHITWHKEARVIERMVRAYYPWPGVFFELYFHRKMYQLKITKASLIDMQGQPGEILVADKKRWVVACGTQALLLEKVIPQGKKEMSGADFIRGHQLKVGMILETED